MIGDREHGPDAQPAEADAFEAHRHKLFGIAYRMLGSVASAEDAVQETWVRWSAASGVAQPAAWLVTVCTRLCVDELRSARVRREQHVGPWLPEPWIAYTPPEPGLRDESLSMAFLVLLEALSPRERAAFLLREVFEEDYDRIASVLEVSPAGARQLVKRARAAVDADRPRFEVDPTAQAALLVAFGAACESGDLAALEALLSDGIVATGDGGGRAFAARRPIVGRTAVARFVMGLFRKRPPGVTMEPAWVNAQIGMVVRVDGVVTSVVSLASRDGRVDRWWAVVDPWKLGHVR